VFFIDDEEEEVGSRIQARTSAAANKDLAKNCPVLKEHV